MGHLKLPLLKNSKRNHYTCNFYAKTIYFNRTLIHVSFSPVKDSPHTKNTEFTSSALDNKVLNLALAVLCVLFTLFSFSSPIIDNSDVNNFVVTSLLQTSGSPVINADVVSILNFRLL